MSEQRSDALLIVLIVLALTLGNALLAAYVASLPYLHPGLHFDPCAVAPCPPGAYRLLEAGRDHALRVAMAMSVAIEIVIVLSVRALQRKCDRFAAKHRNGCYP